MSWLHSGSSPTTLPGDPDILKVQYELAKDYFIFNNINKPAESWDNSFWRQNSSILNITAISDGASSANDTVLPDIDVGVHHGGVDDAALANVDVVSDLKREKRNSFAELLERRPDDGFARDDTVTTNSDIGQVSSDDGF